MNELGFVNDINIPEKIKNHYKDMSLNLYKCQLAKNEQEYLSCFVVNIPDLKTLENEWLKITQIIGAEYLCEQVNEFSRWNIYLMFIVPFDISKELKYKIENNKLFVRKIVVDNNMLCDKNSIVDNINTVILGKDITCQNKKELIINLSLSEKSISLLESNIRPCMDKESKKEREDWINNMIKVLKDEI